MIKKLLILSTISFGLCANEDIKWNFIKHQFINKPHNDAMSLSKKLTISSDIPTGAEAALVAGSAGALTGLTLFGYYDSNRPWGDYHISTESKMKIAAASLSIGTIAGYFMYKYNVKKAEIAAFKDLLYNWDIYKKQCPSEITNFIEPIQELRSLPDFEERSIVFVDSIKDLIKKHFNPNKTGSWFDSKHFIANVSADLGRALTGIADIIASLKK